MKETPEHALLGLVRGKIGSLGEPRGLDGSELAVSTAVEVARAGGQTFLVTPTAPDILPGIEGALIIDIYPDMPTTGADWVRFLQYKVPRIRRGALRDLLLVVIDQSLAKDAIEGLKPLAEWHRVAIAYLPPPMIKDAP